jgi:mono/diheme cytochrome c family protein
MMNNMKQILLRFALLIAAPAAIAQVALGPVSGDAEKGQGLYFDHGCYGCHGYNGIGRRNLANDVSGIMFNEEVFLVYLRARTDKNPLFPTQDMPNYPASSLSDDQAKDIYAYIRTFEDDPPDMQDIPALQGILDDAKSD